MNITKFTEAYPHENRYKLHLKEVREQQASHAKNAGVINIKGLNTNISGNILNARLGQQQRVLFINKN